MAVIKDRGSIFDHALLAALCSPRGADWPRREPVRQFEKIFRKPQTCLRPRPRRRRQRRDANGGAGVAAFVAEHFDHQIGGAVHDLGPVGEAGRRIDEAAEPHHADHFVEVADLGLDLGQQVDRAGARRLLAVLERDAGAELALGFQLALGAETELARYHQDIAGAYAGDIIGDLGFGWARQISMPSSRDLSFSRCRPGIPQWPARDARFGSLLLCRASGLAQAGSSKTALVARRDFAAPIFASIIVESSRPILPAKRS